MKEFLIFILLIYCSIAYTDTMLIQTTTGYLEFDLSEIDNITFSEDVSVEDMEMILTKIPISFLQNSPNPFNPETTISFDITSETTKSTELTIYNLKGQKVKQLVNERLSAGSYSYRWNGRDDNNKSAASGMYFYKLQVDGKQKTKKMLLLK